MAILEQIGEKIGANISGGDDPTTMIEELQKGVEELEIRIGGIAAELDVKEEGNLQKVCEAIESKIEEIKATIKD